MAGRREIKLELIRKFSPYWLAFRAARGEKMPVILSSPGLHATNNLLGKMYTLVLQQQDYLWEQPNVLLIVTED